MCVTYELSVPEVKINLAMPHPSPLTTKSLQTPVFAAIRKSSKWTNWPPKRVIFTNTVSVATNVNVIWTPPPFITVSMAKCIANIATPSILDTRPNLNTRVGWTSKPSKASKVIAIPVQGVLEKYLKPKEWSHAWEIITRIALVVSSVIRNWIPLRVVKVLMRKFIVNPVIPLNLVPKPGQSLKAKQLSRAGWFK